MIGGGLEEVYRYEKKYHDDFDDDSADSSDHDDEDQSLVQEEVELNEEERQRKQADETELAIIHRTRCLSLTLLCMMAFVLGHLIYFYIKFSEEDNFTAEYGRMAGQILATTSMKANDILDKSRTFADLYPVSSQSDALPFATLPDYDHFASALRVSTGANYVIYTPFLESEEARAKWENYSVANQWWLQETADPILDYIWYLNRKAHIARAPVPAPYAPVWQMSPTPKNTTVVNYNLRNISVVQSMMNFLMRTDYEALWSAPVNLITNLSVSTNMTASNASNTSSTAAVWDLDLESFFYGPPVNTNESQPPYSLLLQPVKNSIESLTAHVVAGLVLALDWTTFLGELLSPGQDYMLVVVDSCGVNNTYQINGPDAAFVGAGDLHDSKYSGNVMSSPLFNESTAAGSYCNQVIYTYPTKSLEDFYRTSDATIYSVIVGVLFFITIVQFIVYDKFINRRVRRVERFATKTEAIVSQLFPGKMRNMMLGPEEDSEDPTAKQKAQDAGMFGFGTKGQPMADFFPEATVLYADIEGFQAWSSIREPPQVFELLETLFQAFDEEAKNRRVFKVETVGDCYVAVTGVPIYRKNHALIMARFARSCLRASRRTLRELELTLGPDTSDLGIRIGIHSGAVTAGVLRGERARFQLFGGTMNTTARLVSTGQPNRIHISEQTANLLISNGKEKWVDEPTVQGTYQGKPNVKTYWLRLRVPRASAASDEQSSGGGAASMAGSDQFSDDGKFDGEVLGSAELPELQESSLGYRTQRLIQWNSELLAKLLRRVVARRAAIVKKDTQNGVAVTSLDGMAASVGANGLVVDEVAEVIDMPTDVEAFNADRVQLDPKVLAQLNKYVTCIASMYRNNPFHNFEHASHVAMSVNKLLSRIVAPKISMDNGDDNAKLHVMLHDHTYGITSDPLTQFSCVLVALIHDVDHRGIPNGLLEKEDHPLFAHYQGKSVAEQNSVDLAWSTLISPEFADLRACIYSTPDELRRFRQLVVNCVIATDIFDKVQTTMRKARWEKAFAVKDEELVKLQDDLNRKATIIIEHIIQASDVSHTMQHWEVYQQWNKRLFCEGYNAFLSKRSSNDPSPGWYKGELWFFDNYILPLAKKLDTCGVFGVSSDEFLTYALANRKEWEDSGESIVASWLAEYNPVDYEPLKG